MTLVNLVKPELSDQGIDAEGEDELDDEELEILTEAGIIRSSSSSRRRNPKHVVFAESQQEGISPEFSCIDSF